MLLSAVALNRIALGFFLIVAFSVGLAAVLISIGLLMVHAGRFLARLNPQSELVQRRLPLLSALFIIIVGVVLVAQSLKPVGLVHASALASPKWLLVAGIGLLLGMRHSTDPDHVIAVTTIVTRLRTLRHASFVGMLWGVGHTLTIFIVGGIRGCVDADSVGGAEPYRSVGVVYRTCHPGADRKPRLEPDQRSRLAKL